MAEDPFGFTWGPARIVRRAVFEHANGPYRVLGISTGRRELEIYISPTGKSVRVFRDGKELTA